jgi:predicted AlkP superfamily pyrophosphatase or phosphodiesterase
MKRIISVLVVLVSAISLSGQSLNRPRLVVGIVVDQMRWDFLYRYYSRYAANGGFKRMLNQGHSCENTFIPYSPTVTAPGHASIYTGSIPAIHGITGNYWWENNKGHSLYCTEDPLVNIVGGATADGDGQSPRNMLTTTIGDEIRLATNFKGKVFGVALKDRGGILPAGHSANGAYWYDSKTGNFVTSSYYLTELPGWVKAFNAKRLVDSYYNKGWNLLYPSATYTQSTADEKTYEGKALGKGFPYELKKHIGKSYGPVLSTPYGNTLTAEFAKAVVENERLGADNETDLLAISFSSPDYIGHAYGPNSIEQEDDFLRLDMELGDLLDFFDSKVGKNQYVVFLSADHGVAHIPEFLAENKLPAGKINPDEFKKDINSRLAEKFGKQNLIVSSMNYQFSLNLPLIDSAKLDKDEVIDAVVNYVSWQPGVARVFSMEEIGELAMNSQVKELFSNGYYPSRSGQVQLILEPHWIEGAGTTGTTHGAGYPYDSHIPLLWYGWGIRPGKTNRETYMTDIAATLAALLHIQMPSGCIGKPITEVMK